MADLGTPNWFGSLRGIVQTLEQKSGLNPLLFLDAIFGIPAIGFYAWKGQTVLLLFVWIPLLTTVLFYVIAFIIDRNFLRSEKHVYDMKRLDVLGEKGNTSPELQVLEVPPIENPRPKDDKKIKGAK
jgi:hypothetical protein